MKKIWVLLAAATLLIPISVKAQDTLFFQAECAKGARTYVNQYSNVAYSSIHYNKKLDKCFALVITGVRSGKYDRKSPDYRWRLCNVFEGTIIGEWGSTDGVCYVGEKKCKSQEEFEALIKPYMEE